MATEKYRHVATGAASGTEHCEAIILPPIDLDKMLQEPLHPKADTMLNKCYTSDDIEKIAMILHSSGSTSFPKPILLSNRYLILLIQYFPHRFQESAPTLTYDDRDIMLCAGPLFHVFSFFCCFSAITMGASAVFVEKLPASVDDLRSAISQTNPTMMSTTPIVLEQILSYMTENQDFEFMQRLKLVIFGGAPMKSSSGDAFIQHQINIKDCYGTTEINGLFSSDFDPSNKQWNVLRGTSINAAYYDFEPLDTNDPTLKHLVILPNAPFLATGVANREDGGYDTNDIFREVTLNSGYYIHMGRKDDVLVMENGEKTSPIPMESIVASDPVIKQCAVIGERRPCTCILIELQPEYASNSVPDNVMQKVQRAVKRANKNAPSHSTILPQMIKILPPGRQIPLSDKGTVKRKSVVDEYGDMIAELYDNFLNQNSTCSAEEKDGMRWPEEQIASFLLDSAAEVLGLPASELTDVNKSLFDYGMDSLLSIQLRNRIALHFNHVSHSFVFQYPTVQSMKKILMSQTQTTYEAIVEEQYRLTEELLASYIKRAETDFGVAATCYAENEDQVILLTGTTGSLGAFLLQDLLQRPTVKRVYAMIRGSNDTVVLLDRLRQTFADRSLDRSLLESSKLHVLPMKLDDVYLGLDKETYDRLKKEVTMVQHCAWLLDFHHPVAHYDKVCIRGMYNLLRFAFRSVNPMHVHFISSVSASACIGGDVEEMPLPDNACVAMPIGYAQSKYIVEKLLNYLCENKNFPCIIERLGQACGDSQNGVWNINEFYPLLIVGGGQEMHKMPDLVLTIDWILLDHAASAIADIMINTANQSVKVENSIFHIVNPRRFVWNDLLTAMRQNGMTFDLVSPEDWLRALAQNDGNPAYRLLSFYQAYFKNFRSLPVWKTDKTCNMTPVLDKAPVLDSQLLGKYLGYWFEVGFYNP
ncbi:uncharacterized protein BYT42DRAFT_560672 [Radiomyces spectabilis]|uniref:uncharacterized protein n=1 Tax=Radiomyces spectabilis TaxID=64574 RepID=UPI00221FE546|nr:uncharacterized protein BYT42DRAFT_560672 [Radiomyces spectabilis]KAI8388609.1 hypothetical protein BYT42DRAFT_560672 [Radiomyces spectabilis]